MSDSQESVPRYTKEEVIRRFIYLANLIEYYLSYFKGVKPNWHFHYDPLVLLNVAQSALDDIWRFKAYHLGSKYKRSDAIKRAAYFTKWIIRFRPIYFKRIISEINPADAIDNEDTSLLINEQFALFISLNTISTSVGVKMIELDPYFTTRFLYDLHYRYITADALLNIYEIVKEAVSGKTIVFKIF